MKKFSFRLQRVLDVNEIQEEKAQRHLAEAERARGLQDDRFRAAESAVSFQRDQLRHSLAKGIQAGEALLNHRFGIKLQRQAGEEAKKLQTATERVSDKRKELTEAARRKKTLEILKDKELEKFKLEWTRIESNEQDEIAIRRFIPVISLKESDA